MTREEHIYQLKQYLRGHSICMCPSSSIYWKEHWEEVIKALEQEPKSEWQHDHEILKAYSDGANEVLDKIRAEIEEIIGENTLDDYDFCSGLIVARKIIDKYTAESAHDVAWEIIKNNGVVDL